MTALPVTMTQLDYYTGDWNLNLVVIHEIRFGKSPEFGSEFYFADAESPPEEVPTETEYGAALNGHFTGWDLSFYAASVYNDQGRADGSFQPMLGLFPDRVVHDRLQIVGTAFSAVKGSWIVRGKLRMSKDYSLPTFPRPSHGRIMFLEWNTLVFQMGPSVRMSHGSGFVSLSRH